MKLYVEPVEVEVDTDENHEYVPKWMSFIASIVLMAIVMIVLEFVYKRPFTE